ncbi:MAG: hypothetical protein HFACDABA_01440 [Anaerolineales bacterium]|nr:hypothetical protein [Anaerolineales bacterium]
MTQHGTSDLDPEDSTQRFRRIRTTPEEEETLPPASAPDPQVGSNPPADATPNADASTPSGTSALERLQQTQGKMSPLAEDASQRPAAESGKRRTLNNPFRRKQKPAAEQTQPPARPLTDRLPRPAPPSEKRRLAPLFWTVASVLSLTVNLILILVLLFLLNYVSKLNLQVSQLLEYAKLPQATVQGLYDNFVLMDEAHIRTQIPVTLEVPVQFDIAIDTQTEVVLSQDAFISQAHVTLSTGGLNISNAPADIMLPAGTRLPVKLSLIVPVDKSVPVSLVVPVDIALKETDLHTPFAGLQQVIQPIYCLLDPEAVTRSGSLICEPPVTP